MLSRPHTRPSVATCRRRGSKYHGVKRSHGVYKATIFTTGSCLNLGEFETEEAAARCDAAVTSRGCLGLALTALLSWVPILLFGNCRAYDQAAKRFHRKSALLNFPDRSVSASPQ